MGDDVCDTWMNQYKGKAKCLGDKEAMAFDCVGASNKEDTCFMYNVEADAEEGQASGQVCETGECWSIQDGKARRLQDAGRDWFSHTSYSGEKMGKVKIVGVACMKKDATVEQLQHSERAGQEVGTGGLSEDAVKRV